MDSDDVGLADIIDGKEKFFKSLLTHYNNYSNIVVKGGGQVNDRALNIKIPSELYVKLKAEAEKKNISLASLIRLICSEYFERK